MRTQCLPAEQELISLACTTTFPATRDEIIATATQQHRDHTVTDFMRMFDPDDRFENGIDFINRCEDVELCIRERSNAPKEQLRSP